MAMSELYGTPVMCIAMAPPEQRECVLTSSGVNPSLAAPTLVISAWINEMMSKAMTERSHWWLSG